MWKNSMNFFKIQRDDNGDDDGNEIKEMRRRTEIK